MHVNRDRIKPFFQEILIEDKTALILLLHQKTFFAIEINLILAIFYRFQISILRHM